MIDQDLDNVQPTRSACSSDFTPVFGTFLVFCQLPISFSFLNIPVDLGSEKKSFKKDDLKPDGSGGRGNEI